MNLPAKNLRIIGQGTDNPIDHALEHGIKQPKTEIQNKRPSIARTGVLEIQDHPGVMLNLIRKCTTPNSRSKKSNHTNPHNPSLPPAPKAEIHHIPNPNRTHHLRPPIEHIVEPSSPQIELRLINMVKLVGIKKITRPSSGNNKKHLPVVEKFENLNRFSCHIGVQHVSTPSPIVANNLAGRQDGQRQNSPNGHKYHESYVGSVVDSGSRVTAIVIQNEGNEATDDTPHVEDAPEDGNVSAFPILRRVGGHDGALRGPEEPCADAEDGAGDDGEELVLVVVVVEEGACVEDVGGATCEDDRNYKIGLTKERRMKGEEVAGFKVVT